MSQIFTSRTSFTALVVAFLIHNIEEAIFICRFPVVSPVSFIQPASCSQFILAVSIVSAACIFAYLVALQTKNPVTYLFLSTAFGAATLLNVFVPHIAISIYTSNYTPGLFSAVILILPFSVMLLFKNKQSYTTRKQMLIHIASGLGIGYFLFAITIVFAKLML